MQGGLEIGIGADHQEFLAAHATDAVFPACGGAQGLGHFAQSGIADGVTVRVIDALEVVDVDHHGGQAVAGAGGGAPGLFQQRHGRTAVGQFRERVSQRGVFQPAGFRQATHPLSRFRTFPAWAGLGALDKVFVCDRVRVDRIHAVRTKLTRRASDHLPVVVDFEVEKGG